MKCYFHNDNDAISTCISCGRALCQLCTKEHNNVIICTNSEFCTEKVNFEIKTFEKTQKSYKIYGFFFLIIGFFIFISAILDFIKGNIGGVMIQTLFMLMFASIGYTYLKK
ncbi:MAG TPA: hypothetical protein DDW90_01545 [Cyanobacteria bacterium UBA9971]|nr:hypothetical protein [Cyanobacteria bacterium UBA9971]